LYCYCSALVLDRSRITMLFFQTYSSCALNARPAASSPPACRLVSKPDRPGAGGIMAALDAPDATWNAHARDPALLKAALTAALYPQVAAMDSASAAAKRPTWFDAGSQLAVHPSCMLHGLLTAQYDAPYLVFSEKMKTTQTYLRDVTVVSPMALLLFGGRIEVHHSAGYVLLDGWLKVRFGFILTITLPFGSCYVRLYEAAFEHSREFGFLCM
jgi:hypothetical protein